MKTDLRKLGDGELAQLYRSGNDEAFGVLVERYSTKLSVNIFFYLKGSVQDTMLVEDISQESFIKAMKALREENYQETNNFYAWLCRISHNVSIDYMRHLSRRPTISLVRQDANGTERMFEPEGQESPEDEIIKQEVDFDLNELINMLPADQKEAIMLRFYNELSFKEIVEYIGGDISISTCLGRVRYALINLRKMIREIKTSGRKVLV